MALISDSDCIILVAVRPRKKAKQSVKSKVQSRAPQKKSTPPSAKPATRSTPRSRADTDELVSPVTLGNTLLGSTKSSHGVEF